MKRNVLIIGAGGVAHVVRTNARSTTPRSAKSTSRRARWTRPRESSARSMPWATCKTNGVVKAHGLNALDIKATAALIRATNARIVIQAGTSFLNMAVLAACIETGAAYIDTAIHEDPAKTLRGAALVRELRVEAGAGLRRRRRDRDPGRGLRPRRGQRLR